MTSAGLSLCLSIRHFLIHFYLSDKIACFCAIYFDAGAGRGALPNQFTGEIEIANADSFDAEFLFWHNIICFVFLTGYFFLMI